MNTPWGESQDEHVICECALEVYTAGHGGIGIKYGTSLAKFMQKRGTTKYGIRTSKFCWFEEDCDWAIAILEILEWSKRGNHRIDLGNMTFEKAYSSAIETIETYAPSYEKFAEYKRKFVDKKEDAMTKKNNTEKSTESKEKTMSKKMTAIVKTNDILAAMTAVSKDETRRLLNGVCFEVIGKTATVVATDSYRLVATESFNDSNTDGVVILDLAGIKFKKNSTAIIEFDGETAKIRTIDGLVVNPPVIAGNYPKWRELLPKADAVAEAVTAFSVNPKFFNDMSKAYRAWTGKTTEPLTTEFTGKAKMLYFNKRDEGREFFGIIMPVRCDSRSLKQPITSVTEKEYEAKINEVKTLENEVKLLRKRLAEQGKKKDDMASKVEEKIKEKTGADMNVKVNDLGGGCCAIVMEPNREAPKTHEVNESEDVETVGETEQVAAEVTVETLRALVAGHNVIVTQKNERSCIWVMGETEPLKEELKNAGLRWATKKQAWWYKPAAA